MDCQELPGSLLPQSENNTNRESFPGPSKRKRRALTERRASEASPGKAKAKSTSLAELAVRSIIIAVTNRRSKVMEEQRDADSELHHAVREGSLLRVERALADAATRANVVNARGRASFGFPRGATPLGIACTFTNGNNSLEIVRALLNAGADPNALDNLGRSPLHGAVCFFHHLNDAGRAAERGQIVETLLDANADVHARDNQNCTPLHEACRNGASVHVVSLLLDAGAASNLRDEDGATPLHHACWSGHVELVRLLLNSGGADLEPIDSEGHSPLHYASESGCLQVVRALIEQFGADMFVKDQDDDTPFDLAIDWTRDGGCRISFGALPRRIHGAPRSTVTPCDPSGGYLRHE